MLLKAASHHIEIYWLNNPFVIILWMPWHLLILIVYLSLLVKILCSYLLWEEWLIVALSELVIIWIIILSPRWGYVIKIHCGWHTWLHYSCWTQRSLMINRSLGFNILLINLLIAAIARVLSQRCWVIVLIWLLKIVAIIMRHYWRSWVMPLLSHLLTINTIYIRCFSSSWNLISTFKLLLATDSCRRVPLLRVIDFDCLVILKIEHIYLERIKL